MVTQTKVAKLQRGRLNGKEIGPNPPNCAIMCITEDKYVYATMTFRRRCMIGDNIMRKVNNEDGGTGGGAGGTGGSTTQPKASKSKSKIVGIVVIIAIIAFVAYSI